MSNLSPKAGMQVVIHGNPVDGFKTTGPFKLPSSAISWATSYCDEEWYLSDLLEPVDAEGNPYP